VGVVRGFLRFWYDFLVGDDWKIAASVLTALVIGAVLMVTEALPDHVLVPFVGCLLAVGFAAAVQLDTRSTRRRD
jgi:hypothetical protein